MKQSRTNKIAKHLSIGMIVCVGIWVCLLIVSAYGFGNNLNASVQNINLGPLTLSILSRYTDGGVNKVSIAAGPDLIKFFAIGLVISIAWLFLSEYRHNKLDHS